MTLLELAVAEVECGASQEDMQSRDYAENRINCMSNYELLELLSDQLERYLNDKTGS